MKTLYESLLDKDFDISAGEMIFNKFRTDPEMVEDCICDGESVKDLVRDIIENNTNHMAEDAADPASIYAIPDEIVNDRKFKRVLSKIKGEKIFCADLAYQYDFHDTMDELYWDCHRKKIGRLEYAKILDDVSLVFDVYSIDNYYFMFLVGDDNYIYGFIGSN